MICAGTLETQAQSPEAILSAGNSLALDTVVNTAAETTVARRVSPWRTGGQVTFHVVVTKISGTVGGTMKLQGSMVGGNTATNWIDIGSATTPSDASASYGFNTSVRWYYYRIIWTGTGTMSASFRTYFLFY